MIQRTFHIRAGKNLTLSDVVSTVRSSHEYEMAGQILLTVFVESWDGEAVESQMGDVKNSLPKVEIAGITHRDGMNIIEDADPNMILSFLFFKKRDAFRVIGTDMSGLSDGEAGDMLNAGLREIPKLKGVLLFVAEFGRDLNYITERISDGLDSVPMVGAPGMLYGDFGEINIAKSISPPITNMVFDEKKAYRDYLLAVAFYGEDIHVRASYTYGWTPVGKWVTVTKTDGPFAIKEIDNRPATEVYRKYLGLSPDRVNSRNTCEFPAVVDKDGLIIAHIPVGTLDDGSVIFGNGISEGEQLRLSYGAQFRIFAEVYEDSLTYDDFAPDGMYLVICGNRLLFLKDREHIEVDYYRRSAQELAVLHGNSELYRNEGRGGDLNSAILAFAIREGDACQREEAPKRSCPCEATMPEGDVIPLEYRIMTFMSAVTDDLTEMTRAADAANRAKGAFLSNMTHEIRSPINAVLGMDEMILRESGDSQILDYAENIKSAGNTLLGLVNDVLDMSRIEAGRIEIIPVEYHSASVINDLVTIISQRAEEKGLSLILDIDKNLPSRMLGDEIRLKQVATNILTNALKYTEDGSITLSVHMSPAEEASHTLLTVSVQDTGIGIKEEDMPKLFAAFERIEEKRNRNIEGTGLGLNITAALLDMMGSRLEVESVYGEGSRFFFTVDQTVIDPTPIGDYEKALQAVRAKRQTYHESFVAPEAELLVVDDTPMNLMVLKNLLKQTKVRISTADSGDECLSMIRKKRYDLIFLDDRMPGMSGVETLKRMQDMVHENVGVPVVILTANTADDAKKEYIDKGFDDYLAKPIDPQILEDMLRKYLPADKVQITGGDEKADGAGYSAEFYDETLRMYLEEIPDYASRIEKLYAEGDWEDYTVNVHALKSSSRLIGENELAGLAESLERAGDEGDIDYIKVHHADFVSRYLSMRDKYAAKLPQNEGTGEMISTEKLLEAFSAIRQLADMYDYDSIEDIFGKLSGYSIPDELKAEYDRLYAAFRRVDWEEMVK